MGASSADAALASNARMSSRASERQLFGSEGRCRVEQLQKGDSRPARILTFFNAGTKFGQSAEVFGKFRDPRGVHRRGR
jgi:hypothetical protein